MKTALLDVMIRHRLPAFITGLVLCFLSGCSTIQFVQHEQAGNIATVNRWHHSTLNNMIEISKPLNLQSICGKKAWTTVTTEYTFYNAVATLLVPSPRYLALYSSRTNKVKCYETSLATPKENSATPPDLDTPAVTKFPELLRKPN